MITTIIFGSILIFGRYFLEMLLNKFDIIFDKRLKAKNEKTTYRNINIQRYKK